MVTPQDKVEYKYDPLGRRTEKTVNGNIQRYIYDNEDIIAILDGSNNPTETFTHGPGIDEPLILTKADRTNYYYHADGLGSIVALTDEKGQTIETYTYKAYGQQTIKDRTGAAFDKSLVDNPYLFTARELDSESGLYYYHARYYDWSRGAFTQEDPIGFAGGEVNIYPYVSNSPLRYSDPLGLYWYDDAANLSAGFGDTISGGLTELARSQINNYYGYGDSVDKCSGYYTTGKWMGYAHGAATLLAGGLNGGAKSVFWSGSNKVRAAEFGVTLEKTPIGAILNKYSNKVPPVMWDAASAIFSGNAKGSVLKVGIEQGRTWSAIEKPILNLRKIPIRQVP